MALQATTASWLAPVERLLVGAASQIRVLAALTPIEADRERRRLVGELEADRPLTPSWSYAPCDLAAVQGALAAAERALADGLPRPLAPLYLARVRELLLEASLCAAAGTSRLFVLAQERFAGADRAEVEAASKLCATWLAEPAPRGGGPGERSDSPHPRSLLSRMKAAVLTRKLPFRVVAAPGLAALSATGDSTIYVATDRIVSEEDTVRTVVHEIEGHARPRARAAFARSVLFRTGTARGADDQEGRALLLEEAAGLLGPRRRRQLAARHRAVEAMLEGASFGDVAFSLVREHGLAPVDAVVAAERAFRGSDGRGAGLGRERVYLEAMVRVKAHLATHPADEHVLASGQVATDAAEVLRGYA